MAIIIRFVFSEDSKFPSITFRWLFVWVTVKMPQYQKIDVIEGIDVNKANALKECELCHYWFFKHVGVQFEEHVCNGCYDLLTMVYSLKNIAILTAKGATFRCLLMGVSKNKALKIK